MKTLDASENGIFEIAWSPNGDWLTYVSGEDEVRLANPATGEVRVIGKGSCPSLTDDTSVVLERDDEIVLVTGSGQKPIVTKKDMVKDTPKQGPLVSPDSKRVLFHVCNIVDKDSQQKNAYPYRHFMAIAKLGSRKPKLTPEQWYGGTAVWFPAGDRFAHFEFDSTGGPQVHIASADGEREGTVAGLYPSISPDGTGIAVRPRTGGSLVIYASKGSWRDEDIKTTVLRIPGGAGDHKSANPPVWLDNRFCLVDEGERMWRLDTKRDKAEEMKKIPLPTLRRKHSMVASPDRNTLAMEMKTEEGFGLCLIPLR